MKSGSRGPTEKVDHNLSLMFDASSVQINTVSGKHRKTTVQA